QLRTVEVDDACSLAGAPDRAQPAYVHGVELFGVCMPRYDGQSLYFALHIGSCCRIRQGSAERDHDVTGAAMRRTFPVFSGRKGIDAAPQSAQVEGNYGSAGPGCGKLETFLERGDVA